MTRDDSQPFKPGAPDPMLGGETSSEWDEAHEYSDDPVPAPWRSEYGDCGVQERILDPAAIDPMLLHLHNQELHSMDLEAGVFTNAETKIHSLNKT